MCVEWTRLDVFWKGLIEHKCELARTTRLLSVYVVDISSLEFGRNASPGHGKCAQVEYGAIPNHIHYCSPRCLGDCGGLFSSYHSSPRSIPYNSALTRPLSRINRLGMLKVYLFCLIGCQIYILIKCMAVPMLFRYI